MHILFVLIGGIVGGATGGWMGAFIGIIGGFLGTEFLKRIQYRQQVETSLEALRDEVAKLKVQLSLIAQTPQAGQSTILTEQAPATLLADMTSVKKPIIPGAQEVEERPSDDVSQPTALTNLAGQSIDMDIGQTDRKAAQLFKRAKAWLLGGNTLVRVGAIVLFFGLAFLIKYAADHAKLPVEYRYLGTGIGALALLGVGWRLRERRPAYAMILQGLGVAVIYLLSFAAFRLHHLMPGSITFMVLVSVCGLSAALAVLQNGRGLAVTGVCGGFLAPVLASTGEGSHVMLFSYYMLLSVGIAGIAWFKAWRSLNVIGFIFTFCIGTLWGIKRYQDEMFATTEPFLVGFFVLYLIITLLYARRRKQEISSGVSTMVCGERVDYVDGMLVFGVPIAAFGLQYQMVKAMPFGSALTALALGLIYLPLASLLYRRHQEDYKMLVESFLALSVVFATLAIPFALEATWTATAWALEGAGIVWISLRQRRQIARLFGILVQFAAGVSLVLSFPLAVSTIYQGQHATPWAFMTSALLLASAGMATAYFMHRYAEALHAKEKILEPLLLLWSVLWWWLAGAHEIRRHFTSHTVAAHVIYLAVTAQLLMLLARIGRWRNAMAATALLLPALVICGVLSVWCQPHPFAQSGWLAWPIAIATLYMILRKLEDNFVAPCLEVGHAVTLWLVVALTTWEMGWALGQLGVYGSAWRTLGLALPVLVTLGLLKDGKLRTCWPVARFQRSYREGCLPVALTLFVWVLYANAASNGSASPLPYLPLANPLDLAVAGTLMFVFPWLWEFSEIMEQKSIITLKQKKIVIPIIVGTATFYWLNGLLLRTISRWGDVPLILPVMLRTTLTQAALSIFWAALALGMMLWATRRGMRILWLTGGGLMGVVVLKMFTIDLSRIGTIERIITFISVGILLLLLGYFSPVPPKKGEVK